MTILELKGISKSFGHKTILQNANYRFESNKIYGFIGPNGAGKTTTIKMVLGLLSPDAGSITVDGREVVFGETVTNQLIGYLPDVPEFYHYMDAEEYLMLCGRMTHVPQQELTDRVCLLLTKVGLEDNRIKIAKYSRGMKQRLGIAQALINEPSILICDEPTSALDPKGRSEILKILAHIKAYTTVIFSTHILTDVESICDEVVMLSQQQLLSFEEIRLINPLQSKMTVELKVSDEEKKQLSEHYRLVTYHDKIRIDLEINGQSKEEVISRLYHVLTDSHIYPEHLIINDQTLEQVYMEAVK